MKLHTDFEWPITSLKIPIHICKKAFVSIHGITKGEGSNPNGCASKDYRSQYHNLKDVEICWTTSVINTNRASHYSLYDTTEVYLPYELNIKTCFAKEGIARSLSNYTKRYLKYSLMSSMSVLNTHTRRAASFSLNREEAKWERKKKQEKTRQKNWIFTNWKPIMQTSKGMKKG